MTLSTGFAHEAPTESDTLDALAELIGSSAAEGIWDLSARDLGLNRPLRTPADLRRMAEHMMNIGDLIRVAGRSAKVRVVTYEALNDPMSS